MRIRPTSSTDIPALQTILRDTGLFPPEMLPDMLAAHLAAQGEALWLTCEDGAVSGFCYAEPEALTDGTWNMLAIAVAPSAQNNGAGRALVSALEDALRQYGARVLIADTSGTEEFAATRAFYRSAGYVEEARIRDFWSKGDDKVVFWKGL
ncbi:MAG: GNAT family N-acetyltransferase [Pseudomonadota bacterium]